MNKSIFQRAKLMTREDIVKEATRIRDEIDQILIDQEHWNRCVRKPHEKVVDCDPDGEMKKYRQALTEMIEVEAVRPRVLPDP